MNYKKISNILKKDGVVVFPTETVYGIGANALSKKAIDKIYKIKKRPREKAINIMVGKKEDIEKYAYIKSDIERKIIDKLMPGPLTIILNKKKDFGKDFTKAKTIGIRIPNSLVAQNILKEVDFPLLVSSANISSMPPLNNFQDIKHQFGKIVDVIIDGGIIDGLPSTIVKVVDEKITILREGTLSKEEIESIVR